MSTEAERIVDEKNLGAGPRNELSQRPTAVVDMGHLGVTTREAYALFMAPLYAALAKAQAAFKPLERDREVEVTMKTGGKYTFEYATLAAVHAATRAALNENGLAITGELSNTDNGRWRLTVELTHSSGASKKSSCVFPGDEWQGVGKATTYARRYIEQTMLGVAADHDDDANAADGHTVTNFRPTDRQQRQQPRPPANDRPPARQQEKPPQQERKPEPRPELPKQEKATDEQKPAPQEEKRPSTPPPLPTDEEKAAMAMIEAKLVKEGQPVPEFADLLSGARLALVKAQISARLKELLGAGLTKQVLGERCRKATGKDPKDLGVDDAKLWLEVETKATA